MNLPVLIRDIARKNWFMMRNPVSQPAYGPQIVVRSHSCFWDGELGGRSRKTCSKMCIPDPAILPCREQMFPKCKFQLGNDFSCCGLPCRHGSQIRFWIVIHWPPGPRKTAEKAIRPRPCRPVCFFDGFGNSIAHGDFADVQRHDKGCGQNQIPLVQAKGLFPIIVCGLQVCGKSGS